MRPTGAGWRVGAVILVAAVTLGTAARAEQPHARVHNPAPEPLESELVKLGKLIANANAKLRAGVVGVGTVETAPAQLCCAANLKRMWVRFEEIETILREFGGCYEEQAVHDMVTQVEIAKVDLDAIAKTSDVFAKAARPTDAYGALDALTRAYLNFRRSGAELEPCGAVAWREPADDDRPDAQKKKKSRKTKK